MRKLILIEDSYVMKGLHSVYISRILKKYMNTDAVVIFWESSGWALSKDNLPIIKDGSKLIGSDNKILLTKLLESFKLYLETLKINNIIKGLSNRQSESISIEDICKIKYKDSRMGLGLLSTALRLFPQVNIEEKLDYKLFYQFSKLSIISIEFLLYLSDVFDFELAFFSETVYQTLFLIDTYTLSGGKCPILLDPGAPCVIDQEITSQSINTGKGSRMIASFLSRKMLALPLKLSPKQYLNHYLSGTKNSSRSEEFHTTQTFYSNHVKNLGYELYSRENLLSPDFFKIIKSVNLVLYLQGVTDGPFLNGYSGFATPHVYFKSLIEKVTYAIEKNYGTRDEILFIIKPHPNILNGLGSIHPAHLDKARTELKVSKFMLTDLVKLLEKLKVDFIIVDPLLASSLVLGVANSIHVTHHGTVSLEASSLGLPVICSKISPLAYIESLNNYYIYNDTDNIYKISNAISQLKTNNLRLSNQQSINDIVEKDRYLSDYINDLNDLIKSFKDYYGLDHDEFIIKNNLSFNPLEINTLDKKIQAKVNLIWSYISKLDNI